MIHNILIIKDTGILRQLYHEYLAEAGYNIRSYKNYEVVSNSILELFEAFVLDHDIKDGMSESEWLYDKREIIQPERRILMSGNPEAWNNIEGYKLIKPFELSELEEALKRM